MSQNFYSFNNLIQPFPFNAKVVGTTRNSKLDLFIKYFITYFRWFSQQFHDSNLLCHNKFRFSVIFFCPSLSMPMLITQNSIYNFDSFNLSNKKSLILTIMLLLSYINTNWWLPILKACIDETKISLPCLPIVAIQDVKNLQLDLTSLQVIFLSCPIPYVTHHIKTGQLSVECISRYYSICMGKNKENKKKLRLIFWP